MVKVRIPHPMLSFTHGKEVVEADGRNLRQLIEQLESTYPGLKQALMDDDKLKPDIAIAIDGQITQLGLLQSLKADNEVIILPAVSGG